MSDPILVYSNFGGNFFSCDRPPTATEDVIAEYFSNLGISDMDSVLRAQFFWFDTADNLIYDYVSGNNGDFKWACRTTPSEDLIPNADTDAYNNNKIDYGVLTLLQVGSALNASNENQNNLANKYNDLATKFNDLLANLVSQGLMKAPSAYPLTIND